MNKKEMLEKIKEEIIANLLNEIERYLDPSDPDKRICINTEHNFKNPEWVVAWLTREMQLRGFECIGRIKEGVIEHILHPNEADYENTTIRDSNFVCGDSACADSKASLPVS